MSVNLRLLHQILQSLFLQELLFFFLLLAFHFLIKLLLFSFQISQFAVTLAPENKDFFGQFAAPELVFLSVALTSKSFLPKFLLTGHCKFACLVQDVAVVLLLRPKCLWDIFLGNLGPGAFDRCGFLLFSLRCRKTFQ